MPVLKCDEFDVNNWVSCHIGLQLAFQCPSYVHGDEDSKEGNPLQFASFINSEFKVSWRSDAWEAKSG